MFSSDSSRDVNNVLCLAEKIKKHKTGTLVRGLQKAAHPMGKAVPPMEMVARA